MKTQRPIVAPEPQLLAQCAQRLPLPRRDGRIGQAVDDGQFQVGHPAAGIEREERAIAVQRHDIDAG